MNAVPAWELLVAVMAVVGAAFAVWWKFDGRIKESVKDVSIKVAGIEAQAAMAMMSIAEHKLHAAETFATKAGMQEQTAQIMDAIRTTHGAVERINDRIDRMIEARPSA